MIPLTFRHRAGVSPYTSPFGFAETCVFDKQSPGPFHCGLSFERHPFFRGYGVNMPSSLTTLLPMALGFSPHLPVSVCGTGAEDIHTPFLATASSYFPKLFQSLTPGSTNARVTIPHCVTSTPLKKFTTIKLLKSSLTTYVQKKF